MNEFNIGDITKFDSGDNSFGNPYETISIVINTSKVMIINVNNDVMEHCLSIMIGEEIIIKYD